MLVSIYIYIYTCIVYRNFGYVFFYFLKIQLQLHEHSILCIIYIKCDPYVLICVLLFQLVYIDKMLKRFSIKESMIGFLLMIRPQILRHYCYNDNGNFTSNSTYNTNLNTLLSSLSSNMDNKGFYNASVGQNPDRANAIVLCRGDIQLDTCRSCVQNATNELVNLCPNQKQAMLCLDFCTLRYSNESIFGIRVDDPVVMGDTMVKVSSPDRFKEDLRTLMDDLRSQAASGGSLMKIAAGNRSGPDFQTIFALLQCMPDISGEDCTSCLMGAAQNIPRCCDNSTGVRILAPSCNLRYEIKRFYNITRIQEAQATILGKGGDDKTRTVIIIVLPIVACIILVTCVGIFLKKKMKIPMEIVEADDEISTVESLQYDFGKIRAATNDFSDANKLGQGGFGAVYKGKLQNGKEIAVKRLSRSSAQGDLEFKNEVLLVARLQHRNLVRLLGFALKGTERLLIYEFVQNTSLDNFIFDPIKRSNVGWDRLCKIIDGIARGLLYLHEDSRLRIIHRDLKASNILLDGEMKPKISDFGMARLFVRDETQGNTSRIVGTYGYMAPEYVLHGHFSVKSDVYSFGVLAMEIVTGQKNNSFRNGENVDENMLNFAWRNWRGGTPTNIIDPTLRSTSLSLRDMLRCIHISLLCVQENAVDRPTMASVVVMLNSFSISLPMPSQPAYFMSSSLDADISRLHECKRWTLTNRPESKLAEPSHSSKNDASVSELHPR
ncbi:hypothetical protein Pfo_010063 [Paulownia fortunei]|nr:hypothetical protein Pfo_010063 [Paulownia fortunei]